MRAAAGLLERVVTETEFLPFVDAARLRALSSALDPAWSQEARAGLRVWRAAAHCWSWEMPERNASTLSVWRIAMGLNALQPANDRWRTRWGRWPLGAGEVLTRHSGPVYAVACMVLPGGQPVAVTGSWDGRVRVWDLAAGAPARELGAVNSNGIPLHKRSGPGTNFDIVGEVADGTTVTINCQTTGTPEDGPFGRSTLWDRLADNSYVSDAYILTGTNNMIAPYCAGTGGPCSSGWTTSSATGTRSS